MQGMTSNVRIKWRTLELPTSLRHDLRARYQANRSLPHVPVSEKRPPASSRQNVKCVQPNLPKTFQITPLHIQQPTKIPFRCLPRIPPPKQDVRTPPPAKATHLRYPPIDPPPNLQLNPTPKTTANAPKNPLALPLKLPAQTQLNPIYLPPNPRSSPYTGSVRSASPA